MENYAALISSFDENGDLDEKGLLEILRFNRERSKVDGLFVNGTGGENYILDIETKKSVFKIVKEFATDYKLIAQVGCNDFHEVVKLAEYVKELGYDAVSILTPQYHCTSFSEVKEYFEYMGKHVELPMYLYYFPVLNQITLNAGQFKQLMEIPNMAGIKYTATDLKLAERVKRHNPDKKMYVGYDEFVSVSSLLGLEGAVGVTFNIIGAPISKMKKFVEAEDFVNAQKIQRLINDFLEQIKSSTYQTMRMIMNHYGYACKYSKLPLKNAVEKDMALIEAYETLLKEVELI